MTYFQALEPNFRQAAAAIWYSEGLDAKTSYSAHRIQKALDKVFKEAGQLQQELALKHCKLMEVGEKKTPVPQRQPNGHLCFESPEKEQAFNEEFEKTFTEKKLELKVNKLPFNALGRVQGISPIQWGYLEPIVEGFPQEEGNA